MSGTESITRRLIVVAIGFSVASFVLAIAFLHLPDVLARWVPTYATHVRVISECTLGIVTIVVGLATYLMWKMVIERYSDT